MLPWNNWFHCIGSTYGTWVRGDPRGWRARHHREHVEGDYRNPPPRQKYSAELSQSKRGMKREPVFLDAEQRFVACREFARTLLVHEVELVELAIGAAHFHVLARFTPVDVSPNEQCIPGLPEGITDRYELLKRSARRYIGYAKKNTARTLSEAGLVLGGGVWAVRSKIEPVTSRQHQLNVVRYIRSHAEQGAALWSDVCGSEGPPERTAKA